MNLFLRYNAFSFIWTLIILVLCLMPGEDLPSVSIINFDKLEHIAVYVILACSMYYGWKKQDVFHTLHRHTFLKILIITSGYGFAVEVMQDLFTSDRHFDIYDAVANAVGAATGSLLAIYLKPEPAKPAVPKESCL